MNRDFFWLLVVTAFRQLCLVGSFMILSACENPQVPPQDDGGLGSVVGANYTHNGIQSFSVDGAWGANVLPFTGGGSFVCCARYPKHWSPNLTVLVEWRRSDVRGDDGQWKIISLKKVVHVEKYIRGGNVYVLFLPDDEVRVYVSEVGVGSPEFPSNPGYPEDAKKGRE
jgi:hypothetical protein